MDSQADYDRKVRAMFERARVYVHEVSIRFVLNVMELVVEDTPGWENQDPADTLYKPTGRLRGGYRYSEVKLERASRWEDGPYSFYGEETLASLEAAMRARRAGSFYIVNDVAYAYIVREGLGRHAHPRDFLIGTSASSQAVAMKVAKNSMRTR